MISSKRLAVDRKITRINQLKTGIAWYVRNEILPIYFKTLSDPFKTD